MHAVGIAGALVVLASAATAAPRATPVFGPPAPASRPVLKAMGTGGLRFEPNRGQTDPRVRYLARMGGATLFVTNTEAVLRLSGPRPMPDRLAPRSTARATPQMAAEPDRVLRMRLEGANASPKAVGMAKLPGVVNYFIGKDPKKWRTSIPTYGKVMLANVYPKTDLVYYDTGGRLEYDFVLKPGADPKRIAMRIDGADRMRVAGGDLLLTAGRREIRWRKPVAYQVVGGRRVEIACRYDVRGPRVAFQVARYDRERTLVVDPVMEWSTTFGGDASDVGWDVLASPDGGCVVGGWVESAEFPRFGTSFSQPSAGDRDAFVTRMSACGGIIWSATFGGSREDNCLGLARTASGDILAVGYTDSASFATTPGSAYPDPIVGPDGYMPGRTDGFLCRIHDGADGVSMNWCTRVGGTNWEWATAVAEDPAGDVVFGGYTSSSDLPMTDGACISGAIGGEDGFIGKLSGDGRAVRWMTYLGGPERDGVANHGLTLDADGSAIVTGSTFSSTIPGYAGDGDCFIAKVSSDGSTLLWMRCLGSPSFEWGHAVQMHPSGDCILAGSAMAGFPSTLGALDREIGAFPDRDGFVARISSATGETIWCTLFGGPSDQEVYDIAIDPDGHIILVGEVESGGLPLAGDPYDATQNGDWDWFLARLTPDGSALTYSTFYGGAGCDQALGVDANARGEVFVTGFTGSSDYPVFGAEWPGGQTDSYDAFVVKLSLEARPKSMSTFLCV